MVFFFFCFLPFNEYEHGLIGYCVFYNGLIMCKANSVFFIYLFIIIKEKKIAYMSQNSKEMRKSYLFSTF